MSLESEITALRAMMPFMNGEKLLAAHFGTVNGPGIEGRVGILFVTSMRVGISAEAGVFTSASLCRYQYNQVELAFESRSGGICVKLLTSAPVSLVMVDRISDTFSIDSGPDQLAATVSGIRYFAACEFQVNLESSGRLLRQQLGCNDWDGVDRSSSLILSKQPDCIEALMARALVCRRRDLCDAAIAAYGSVLALDPPNSNDVKSYIASTFLEAGMYADAIRTATEVVDRVPLAMAFSTRAIARNAIGEAAAAVADAKRAIDLDSTQTGAWHLLARHAISTRDTIVLERSIAALQENKAFLVAARFRCRLLIMREEFQFALDYSAKAIAEFPGDLSLALSILEASMELGDGVASPWIQEFDRLHIEDEGYQFVSTLALLQAGKSKAALERFNRIKGTYDSPRGVALLAILEGASFLESGAPNAAAEVAIVALRDRESTFGEEYDERRDAMLHYVAGKALVQTGRFVDALPHLREVESRLNDHDSSLRWIGKDFAQLLEQASQGSVKISYDNIVSRTSSRAGIFETLRILSEALEASGRHREQVLRVMEDRARFDEPPLVAVMGEYSVGKSSFINALIRRNDLLPTGDGVTTGTITILRYGEQERMRAVFKSGRIVETDSLQPVDRFVRETDADERRDLHHVDVFVKADVLRRISVVDSPGLNAPFPEHKAITEGFLAESDAICFLFNVENTGKSGEAAFLDKLQEHRRKAIGVVNQIDLVNPADAKEVVEAVDTDFPSTFTAVFGVSAKRALDGLRRADPALHERSGMVALESWMESNLLVSARQIKADAVRARAKTVVEEVRKARGVFDREVEALLKGLQERRSALLRWTGDQLRSLLHEELGRLRANIDRTISDIAETTASRSSPSDSPPAAFFDQQSRLLVDASKAMRDGLLRALLDRYQAEVGALSSFLGEVRKTEWHESMREGLMQVQMECTSWGKDLADYLEQPIAFLDGFIEGRGLAYVVYVEVANGSRNRADIVRAAIAPRLAFLHERIGLSAQRWASELRSNFEESLSRLDRQLRTEAARVREQSFRSIEALDVLFAESPATLSPPSRARVAS